MIWNPWAEGIADTQILCQTLKYLGVQLSSQTDIQNIFLEAQWK